MSLRSAGRSFTCIRHSPSAICAAKEVCPLWPGQPMTAHWGILRSRCGRKGPKRSSSEPSTRHFWNSTRVSKIFMSLRLESIDKMALQRQLDAIGEMRADAGEMELFDGTQRDSALRRGGARTCRASCCATTSSEH